MWNAVRLPRRAAAVAPYAAIRASVAPVPKSAPQQAGRRGMAADAAPVKVPIALVKELRASTLAGYADVQKALRETRDEASGDFDMKKATIWLKEKGMAAASKRSAKVAAEGAVAVTANGDAAVLAEINAETDFVARGPRFLGLLDGAARAALQMREAGGAAGELAVDALSTQAVSLTGEGLEDDRSVKASESVSLADHVGDVAAAVGEKLDVRRARVVAVPEGAYGVTGVSWHGVKFRFSR
jgi:elongation factor Ts